MERVKTHMCNLLKNIKRLNNAAEIHLLFLADTFVQCYTKILDQN